MAIASFGEQVRVDRHRHKGEGKGGVRKLHVSKIMSKIRCAVSTDRLFWL
jgi:hypothetical protein